MPNTWVVVADSGSARIFTADSPIGAIIESETFAHSEVRVEERRLVSDRQGRTMTSTGRRHAFSSEVGPKETETQAFAKLLADRLAGARAKGDLEHLVLVAAPEFLGKLRGALDEETRKRVEAELSLNLTTLTAAEIRKRLPERLYSSLAAH